MQIDSQLVLPAFEKAGGIAFFDLEATGLHGDYNSILIASLKPYGKKPISFVVSQPGHDQKVVREFRDALSQFPIWCSFYGKGFDIPMLQARLLHHALDPLPKHHHIDLYFQMKYKVKTSRHSQAHLLEWLGTKQRKMTLAPTVWNLEDPVEDLKTLRLRCESDCSGLEALYDKVKHLIIDITR